MNEAQLRQILPRASKSVVNLNTGRFARSISRKRDANGKWEPYEIDDNLIYNSYLRTRSQRKTAKEMELSLGCVKKRLAPYLMIPRKGRRPTIGGWTKAEDQVLLELYQTDLPASDIIPKLPNRTMSAICQRARRLNIGDGTRSKLQSVNRLKTNLKRHGHTYLGPSTRKTSGWTEVGGQRFYARSGWEANYARYLEWLKSRQEIKSWEHEPETFWFKGILRGCVSYMPDFLVRYHDQDKEYHEVKGWMDARSQTKIRRFRKHFPQHKLVVRDAKWFKSNARKLKHIVPGWK